MMRIVLVQPEHEMNVGACARAMKNFGFTELFIVKPKANPTGKKAIMYSKHAKDVLQKAKIVETLDEATAGCDFVIGTTGIARRGRDTLREPITPRQLSTKLKARLSNGKHALVFGREGTGLNKKEISQCDFIISVPASKKYPVMNLSHALAVILYELRAEGSIPRKNSGKREKEELVRVFSRLTDSVGGMRNRQKPKLAFRRIIGRSLASPIEISSLLCVFKKLEKEK